MEEKEFDAINVVPLVDVMLVVLTIVLMTSTFIATGSLSVELPRASKNVQETLKTRVVEIDKNGYLYLDSKFVSLAGLKTSLTSLSRETAVLIRADKNLRLQVFIDVLDLVKGMRFKKVSIQTEVSG